MTEEKWQGRNIMLSSNHQDGVKDTEKEKFIELFNNKLLLLLLLV